MAYILDWNLYSIFQVKNSMFGLWKQAQSFIALFANIFPDNKKRYLKAGFIEQPAHLFWQNAVILI